MKGWTIWEKIAGSLLIAGVSLYATLTFLLAIAK